MANKQIKDLGATSPATGDQFAIDNQANLSKKVTIDQIITFLIGNTSIELPIVYSDYIEKNQRNLDEHLHGSFGIIVTAGAFSSGSPLADTSGLAKLVFIVNAGADISGTFTITGTSVDRDTGVETPADTEAIAVDALTTDNSDTDAEGNTRHAFIGAYISNKWWKGAFTLTTADLNISDVDVYNIAFNQFDDRSNVTINTFDVTFECTNASGWFFAYLYLVDVTAATKKLDISRITSLELPVADTGANLHYRLREGNIAQVIDGTVDGIWIDMFFGPSAQNYFNDVSIKLWATYAASLV